MSRNSSKKIKKIMIIMIPALRRNLLNYAKVVLHEQMNRNRNRCGARAVY